jgi:hypothetical protein
MGPLQFVWIFDTDTKRKSILSTTNVFPRWEGNLGSNGMRSRKGAISVMLMAFTALFRRDNDKWVMRKMTKHVE